MAINTETPVNPEIPNSKTTQGQSDAVNPSAKSTQGQIDAGNPNFIVSGDVTNALLWSEQFEQPAWVKTNADIETDAFLSPDGVNTTADKLIPSGTTVTAEKLLTQNVMFEGGDYTLSIYARLDVRFHLSIAIDDGVNDVSIGYDILNSITIAASLTPTTPDSWDIEVLSDGWRRISITQNVGVGLGNIKIAMGVRDNFAYVDAAPNGFYLWGAQLEKGLVAGDYVKTTATQAMIGGIAFPDIPNSKTTTAQSDAVNPISKTVGSEVGAANPNAVVNSVVQNLLFYSEELDNNIFWTKAFSSVTANQVISPNGDLTGDELSGGVSQNPHYAYQVLGEIEGGIYTFSVYVKSNLRDQISLVIGDGETFVSGGFDLTLETFIPGSHAAADNQTILNVGDGWHRCSITYNLPSGGGEVQVRLGLDGSFDYSSGDAGGMFIWGAQLAQSTLSGVYTKTTDTPLSSNDILPPNSVSSIVSTSSAAPNSPTDIAISEPVAPNNLIGQPQSTMPRSLTPLVAMSFDSGKYSQNGSPVLFDDLFTYARPSSATFMNRRIVNNKAEYFLDTQFVGDAENLISHSENIAHSDWIKLFISTTEVPVENVNGDLTAYKAIPTSDTRFHTIRNPFDAIGLLPYTYSVDFKYAGHRYTQITLSGAFGAGDHYAIFDILSGTITSTVDCSPKIESLGGGWWRCSVSRTTSSSAAGDFIIHAAETGISGENDQWAGNDVDGFLISRAQIVQSAIELPYIKTASTGVIKSFTEALRIEYSSTTGENLGVLIEGGSTNSNLWSEEFDRAEWTKNNSLVTANATTAPDNVNSADLVEASLTATTAPRVSSFNGALIIQSGEVYTVSAFIKRKEVSLIQIWFNTGAVSNNPRVNFDLISGTITAQDADIDNAQITPLSNDWVRISATITMATVSLIPYFQAIKSPTASRNLSEAWTVGEGFYIWGAQIEELPLASSYIRTEGSAVTRAGDELSLPSAGNYNQSSGTITAQSDMTNQGANQIIVSVDAGTDNDRVELFIDSLSKVATFIKNSGATVANITGAADISFEEEIELSLTFDSGVVFYEDSISIGSDPLTNMPACTTINIGRKFDGSSLLFGHIKTLSIYDKALTAQEVAFL